MSEFTRRQLLAYGAAAGAGLLVSGRLGRGEALAASSVAGSLSAIAGGSLDPTAIPKYVERLVVPPAMPESDPGPGARNFDYYAIAVRQFEQQVLPGGMPATTVWSYGSVDDAGSFNYPALTIEARWARPVRVKWINQLVDAGGNFLPHLLAVDQTLHWANPPGGVAGRDGRGADPTPYVGPVPIVTHLHGSEGVTQESDGYAEAWFLPEALDLPAGFASRGTFYDIFRSSSALGGLWEPGAAVFQYPNRQRATTLWYHDHTLGMTRVNVYAGPAGFYLLRGGPHDAVRGKLPAPAPGVGDDPFGTYYEIPIAIQDRSFNADGSLFYPDNRAFFEGLESSQLQIPFIPDVACQGLLSDVPPIWNPEFFGNTIVVNGRTWPFLEVEQRRYRFRFLNGCNSRFLILRLSNGLPFWQIGTEGGFLPSPVMLQQLLIAPAERADVVVDFTNTPVGSEIILQNLGPDEPFGGGVPGVDFTASDPATTGQVLQLRVVAAAGVDTSTPPDRLGLPRITPLGPAESTRQVTLNEEESTTVRVADAAATVVLDCASQTPFGPTAALLGTPGTPLGWDDPITENPAVGATEVWEMHNFTEDAHPIHIHEVQFQVVERQPFQGKPRPAEPWETGFKDTVIAYPGEITRIKARFDTAGLFVWHCHIVEHEDNEMMRPYRIGPQA